MRRDRRLPRQHRKRTQCGGLGDGDGDGAGECGGAVEGAGDGALERLGDGAGGSGVGSARGDGPALGFAVGLLLGRWDGTRGCGDARLDGCRWPGTAPRRGLPGPGVRWAAWSCVPNPAADNRAWPVPGWPG